MSILNALTEFCLALLTLIAALIEAGLPWLPLMAWIAFWLLAVNWSRLFPEIERLRLANFLPLGLVGLFLLGFLSVLVWGVIAPPDGGTYNVFGLQLSNLVGKTVSVTALFVIAAMCGSVQLSGLVAPWCLFEEPVTEDDHGGHDHHGGHDDHGHGHHAHGDHGHSHH
jgi:hypothetical protein